MRESIKILLVAMLISVPAFARTIYVPSQYQTIQAGINAALNWDTVMVANGLYRGVGNRHLDFVGRTIVVKSENGPRNCIIDCEDVDLGFYFHSGEAENAVVDGFTIVRGYTIGGSGVFCENASPTISHCIMYDGYALGCSIRGGAICLNYSSATIKSCTISHNTCLYYGGGIFLYNSSPLISNTIVEGNAGNGAVYFLNSSGTTIEYCDFYNHQNGNFSGNPPPALGQITTTNINGDSCDTFMNIYLDPLFADSMSGNFSLQQNSPCIDAGDPNSHLDPDNTIADIGALFFNQAIVQQVSIALTPYGLPIYIPATGGTFHYNIAVANNSSSVQTADVWCMVTLPNGLLYGPVLGPINIIMPQGFSANRDRDQDVPISAPEGYYIYRAYIGIYPNVIMDQDSFPFMKICDYRGHIIHNWLNAGDAFEE